MSPTPGSPDSNATRRLLSDRAAWLIAIVICAIAATQIMEHIRLSPWGSANPKSRFATIEALVDQGTYVIDNVEYRKTMDRVKVDGHLYSSKPPMLSTAVAGIYWTFQKITGMNIRDNEHAVVFTCIFFSAFLLHLWMLITFWRFSRLLVDDDVATLVGFVAICFTFVGAGYATDLQNHSVASAIALGAFYYAYRIRHDVDVKPWHWPLAGFLCGALPTVDIPSAFISVAIGLYLLTYDPKKTLTVFMAAAMPVMIIHFIITWNTIGSLVPAYMQRDLYERPHADWSDTTPWIVYAFHASLGHHGVFSMTPVFFLSAAALFTMLRHRLRLWREAVVVAGVFLVHFFIYTNTTRNYGGVCVGFRWLIPTMPLLFLFFVVWLGRSRPSRAMWAFIVVAMAVSGFHTQNAMANPWRDSAWHTAIVKLGKRLDPNYDPEKERAEDEQKKREKQKRDRDKKRQEQRRKERERRIKEAEAKKNAEGAAATTTSETGAPGPTSPRDARVPDAATPNESGD